MTNPECSGVGGGDHGHQAATEQPLRYVHVRFIILMNEVHGICGVYAVKVITRIGTNYDASKIVKELKFDIASQELFSTTLNLREDFDKKFSVRSNDSYYHANRSITAQEGWLNDTVHSPVQLWYITGH